MRWYPIRYFLNLNLLEVMTKITINSAMDAIGQSIEAIISKKANKISDKYAYEFINLITKKSSKDLY